MKEFFVDAAKDLCMYITGKEVVLDPSIRFFAHQTKNKVILRAKTLNFGGGIIILHEIGHFIASNKRDSEANLSINGLTTEEALLDEINVTDFTRILFFDPVSNYLNKIGVESESTEFRCLKSFTDRDQADIDSYAKWMGEKALRAFSWCEREFIRSRDGFDIRKFGSKLIHPSVSDPVDHLSKKLAEINLTIDQVKEKTRSVLVDQIK